jgi:hypothetical protein
MLLLEQSGPTACLAKYDSGVMRGEKGGRKKRQRVEARKETKLQQRQEQEQEPNWKEVWARWAIREIWTLITLV